MAGIGAPAPAVLQPLKTYANTTAMGPQGNTVPTIGSKGYSLPGLPALPNLPMPGGTAAAAAGGGTIGAGGGGGGGAGSGSSSSAEVAPYLQQVMDMYKGLYAKAGDLYDKPLDFASERANMRADQSQKLNELRTAGGARGGLWTSDLASLGDTFGRDIAGAESGFTNRSLDAKRNILGDMTSALGGLSGAAGTTATAQANAANALQQANALNLDAWKAQMQLPLEYYKAQQAGQMNQLSLIKSLL